MISFHSGQMCTAGSRIFVHAQVYDAFVKGLTAAAQAAKGGNGFDPSATSGPVVSQAQFEVRVARSYIIFTHTDLVYEACAGLHQSRQG